MSWKLPIVVLFAFISTLNANFLDFSVCPGKPSPIEGPLSVYSEICKRRSVSLATGNNICNLTDEERFEVIFKVNEIKPDITANVSAMNFDKTAETTGRIYLPTSLETASIDSDLKNEKDFNGTVDPSHQFHRYIILTIDITSLAIPEERYNYVLRGD